MYMPFHEMDLRRGDPVPLPPFVTQRLRDVSQLNRGHEDMGILLNI